MTKDEACDDGNRTPGDGCAGNCLRVEPGYSCIPSGQPCHRVARCGDGVAVLPELCDDGNKNAGDGCSPTCKIEIGWKCSGSPSVCTHTTCGDGKVEGAEGCDDNNAMPFDGCSSDCQNEPNCKGASCTSKCGDGIVLGEDCDDGNNLDGDGCSHDCNIEPGFTCSQPVLGDKMEVPVVYRDFKFHNPTDFEAGVQGSYNAALGIVKPDLDANGKPVFSGITGGTIHIESATTFGEWYHDKTGVNHATATKMALWNNGNGGYVNRYGANGEQWNVTDIANWCGTVADASLDAEGKPIPCSFRYQQSDTNPTGGQTDCQKMEALGYERLNCFTDASGTYKAYYITKKLDGNPLFFPVDGDTTVTPKSEFVAAQVPSEPKGLYDATNTWPFDLDSAGNKRVHNFSFTSEVRYWFKYESGKTYTLDFVGDDDVWVFINKKLALDLGGIHTPVQDSVTLDAAAAAKLGNLKPGNVYEIAVFQAERQTTCSSYKLTLSGFNAAPSDCQPVCGDGIVGIGEECDDGVNAGGYGKCGPGCKLGNYCGDGIVQNGEDCDDGINDGQNGHCPSGCRILIIL